MDPQSYTSERGLIGLNRNGRALYDFYIRGVGNSPRCTFLVRHEVGRARAASLGDLAIRRAPQRQLQAPFVCAVGELFRLLWSDLQRHDAHQLRLAVLDFFHFLVDRQNRDVLQDDLRNRVLP